VPGIVWIADVAPESPPHVRQRREEQEYVIHTRGLKITTLDETDYASVLRSLALISLRLATAAANT
jgi:hypothetical protein